MKMEEGKKFLVVDDDAVFSERLARGLHRRGFSVQCAGNFDEARMIADQVGLDFATVDLRMPGRSGLEVVKMLKEYCPWSKILILTGFGSIATAVQAVKLGAHQYLTKPADIEEILKALSGEQQPKVDAAAVPSLARVEWEHIDRIVQLCKGNISKAAKLLGLHRRSLQRKLSKNPPACNE